MFPSIILNRGKEGGLRQTATQSRECREQASPPEASVQGLPSRNPGKEPSHRRRPRKAVDWTFPTTAGMISAGSIRIINPGTRPRRKLICNPVSKPEPRYEECGRVWRSAPHGKLTCESALSEHLQKANICREKCNCRKPGPERRQRRNVRSRAGPSRWTPNEDNEEKVVCPGCQQHGSRLGRTRARGDGSRPPHPQFPAQNYCLIYGKVWCVTRGRHVRHPSAPVRDNNG